MPKLPYQRSRNDLHVKVKCNCPDPKLGDVGINRTIYMAGYADANFFDNVNSEPTDDSCDCGRPYRYQWFRDGLEFSWLDEKSLADCVGDIRSDLAEIMAR